MAGNNAPADVRMRHSAQLRLKKPARHGEKSHMYFLKNLQRKRRKSIDILKLWWYTNKAVAKSEASQRQ